MHHPLAMRLLNATSIILYITATAAAAATAASDQRQRSYIKTNTNRYTKSDGNTIESDRHRTCHGHDDGHEHNHKTATALSFKAITMEEIQGGYGGSNRVEAKSTPYNHSDRGQDGANGSHRRR